MYMVGGGAQIPEIKNALETKRWVAHVLSIGEIVITMLGAEDILSKGELGAVLKGPDEIGLASLIINSVDNLT